MRITTKVIQNNSLNNINTNKLLQDKLSQQMSTEKKVSRPSDDPIVAIRALRLRTNVNQVTQYYSKNVPDAESWLEVTESALSSMSDVITDMIKQCNKGSNEDLTTVDRQTILTALKALKEEVYSTGNADYAGRYIFTGYRTDTALTFGASTKKDYTITEQIDNGKIDKVTHVNSGNLLGMNESNYLTGQDANGKDYKDIIEQDIEQSEVYRIRLSYDSINTKNAQDADKSDLRITVWDDAAKDYKELEKVDDGTGNEVDINYKSASIYDSTSPYESVGDNDVVVIEETGEMLLGKNVYNKLMALKDDASTSTNEGEIRINYKKSDWESNDLRPEHYFACETTENNKTIKYNEDYLKGISDEDKQAIEYDVGLNQTIRVNTTADEVFSHDIARDVEDMIKALEDTVAMEEQLAKFEKMLETETNPDNRKVLENQIAAMEKSFTLLKEKTQQLFESGITKMQGHLDNVNYAVTENGTRGKKLELISNRLMSQKTNFETLRSENEDIDITDVAIKLSSAELTYSSALMATGKVLQNNLMNFI